MSADFGKGRGTFDPMPLRNAAMVSSGMGSAGALFAASGVGAAIGATAGLVGGGAARQKRAQQIYAAAYQDCMAGRVR